MCSVAPAAQLSQSVPGNFGLASVKGKGRSVMTIRILIADDHEVVRKGLRSFLEPDADLEIVGEAVDGDEAVRLARRLRPDVVLMDLLMPGMDGVTATQHIRQEFPHTEVVALTSVLEDASVVGAVRAGAVGYLLKDTRVDELLRAIKAAAAGQVQLSPEAAARLMREVRSPDAPEALSPRETEVLRLVARGRANKEIAGKLGIGEKTVKTHVSRILGKLGVQSRTQAALYAGRVGLLPLHELGAGESNAD
jgi:two-component system, NarL family, response regulator LiaR